MDLSVYIGDFSPLVVVAFLFGSVLFAAAAVIATDRFGANATLVIVGMAVVAAVIHASRVWLEETLNTHANRPELTRLVDWFNHLQMSGVAFLTPAVVVAALALILRRTSVPVATKIAVISVGAMVGIALGVSAHDVLMGLKYNDPPT
jgi:hypothetical protein